MNKPLAGKAIAVIVEHKFIPEEIEAYRNGFHMLGADVHFISRLWYGDYRPGHPSWTAPVFHSDVDPTEQAPWNTPAALKVDSERDVSAIRPEAYAAVIMAANYVSVRLRYPDAPDISDPRRLVQSAPMVRFFAQAMSTPGLVKGALCHGLWILTPHPELLKARRVTCHTVVMADILNCGAEVVFEDTGDGRSAPAKVVTDNDLVTGFSRHDVLPFIEAIADRILAIENA